MGYYIEGLAPHNKLEQLVKLGVSFRLAKHPIKFADLSANVALLCCVDNGFFEALGLCFDEVEFNAFNRPEDGRPRQWILMDKAQAYSLTGYSEWSA